jgi:serine protease Do
VTLGEMAKQREARAGSDESDARGGAEPRIGLTVAPAGKVGGAGEQGVVVTSVEPNGIAESRGFRTGDVILEVGGRMVATPEDVRKALTDARGEDKRSVLMRVKSGDATKFVSVPLARA